MELAEALEAVAAGAVERDARPRFPHDALGALRAAGVLGATVPGPGRRPLALEREWALVRAVARADCSVGRILDGHLNAVERLAVQAPPEIAGLELEAVARGELLLGVWGADPLPGEGEPARVEGGRIVGVKVFCSGAGGLDRALVTARDRSGAQRLAYVDLSEGVEVDRSWYRGAGMRASESHRVVFSGAPVVALIGGPGALAEEPYFGRDAIRTAATWAGAADAAVDAALDALAARGDPDDLSGLAMGRMLALRAVIDAAFERAARLAPQAGSAAALSVEVRWAVARACEAILDEAGRAVGSRPYAAGGVLDRVRRDLGIFLLQHRLDPLLARLGRARLEQRR